jgi:hypothetical protein
MAGFFITALFCFGIAGWGRFAFDKLVKDLDPALGFGISGLLGLGSLGTGSLVILLIPGGARWAVFVVGPMAVVGMAILWKYRPPLSLPRGSQALFLLGAVLIGFCSWVAVIAPSDSFDWDTLAYHLAVPKLWMLAGRMHYISFIHHSNFPGIVDDLYVWGLGWGGESGAKAFSWMFGLFGAIAIFGFARSRYSAKAAWWALLAYVGIPLVGWECGTAYIDVSNGLFVGLAILFGAAFVDEPTQSKFAWLTGIFMGFAAASKYTGLQTILAVTVVGSLFLIFARKKDVAEIPGRVKAFPAIAAILALLICSPWYLKNVVNTGNPVYPFFYSVFHGKNWDTFSDKIYRHQQQTFGAGRPYEVPGQDYVAQPLQVSRIGAAVLGLAYQPGRYTDPEPTQGGGFPFESIGVIPIAGLLVWLLSGKSRRFESACAASIGISLAMWFVLSEQSRYILGLFFPACVLAGGAVATLRVGTLLAGASVVQLIASAVVYTRYPYPSSRFAEKLKVVIGGQTPDEYRHRFISFFDPAQELNSAVKNGRVALYDEVFGFLLDVPYFWANPGHSTEMGYEQMTNESELMASFRRLGITYVYINLGQTFGHNPTLTKEWLQAAGLEGGPPTAYPNRASLLANPESSYKVFLAEAIARGDLLPYKSFGSEFIFTVAH